MNRQLWLLCVAAVLGLAACGGKKQAPASNQQTPAQAAAGQQAESTKIDMFADAALLQKAQDELKALPRFGGKALMVFQDIFFYRDERIKSPCKTRTIRKM